MVGFGLMMMFGYGFQFIFGLVGYCVNFVMFIGYEIKLVYGYGYGFCVDVQKVVYVDDDVGICVCVMDMVD